MTYTLLLQHPTPEDPALAQRINTTACLRRTRTGPPLRLGCFVWHAAPRTSTAHTACLTSYSSIRVTAPTIASQLPSLSGSTSRARRSLPTIQLSNGRPITFPRQAVPQHTAPRRHRRPTDLCPIQTRGREDTTTQHQTAGFLEQTHQPGQRKEERRIRDRAKQA